MADKKEEPKLVIDEGWLKEQEGRVKLLKDMKPEDRLACYSDVQKSLGVMHQQLQDLAKTFSVASLATACDEKTYRWLHGELKDLALKLIEVDNELTKKLPTKDPTAKEPSQDDISRLFS